MDRLTVKRQQVREVWENRRRASTAQQLVVGQIMSVAPTCIRPDLTVLELVKLFHSKRFRHLLVTDERGRLAGVISDRDVLGRLGPMDATDQAALVQTTAAQVMSTDLITSSPRMGLAEAVEIMVDHGIGCLPVLAGETLVGILTNTDLHLTLQALLEADEPVVTG